MTVNALHPWVKGFKPPSKCPKCSRVYTLIYTGQVNEDKFHVYRCEACGSDIAAPTFYAYCDVDNSLLEKDSFYTPCWDDNHKPRCRGFKPMAENSLRCEHFKPAGGGELDERDRRQIESSEKPFKLDPFEEARRERLRRLTEGG